MDSQVIAAFVSAIIGGLVVSLMNYLFTRKKTNTEIKNLELQNQKIGLEIQQLQNQVTEIRRRLIGVAELGTKRVLLEEEERVLPEGVAINERTKKPSSRT